jgi:hypothetical protein
VGGLYVYVKGSGETDKRRHILGISKSESDPSGKGLGATRLRIGLALPWDFLEGSTTVGRPVLGSNRIFGTGLESRARIRRG